jgi:hypothetical protein
MWRISMFSRYRSCVLLYKSAYYKVITYLQETCSVFSIQFFFAVVTTLCKDSILYIYNNIYI